MPDPEPEVGTPDPAPEPTPTPAEPAAVVEPAPAPAAPVVAPEPAPADDGKGTLLTGKDAEPVVHEGAPDEYEKFEMPEGVTLDEGLRDQAIPLMKELDLSQDQAQKCATWLANLRQTEATQQGKSLDEENKSWAEASKNHEVYGGAQFKENMGRINEALSQVAVGDYRKIMDSTGYGNHPDVIHTWHNIAAKIVIKEDQPGGQGDKTKGERDEAAAWYPDLAKADAG